MTNDMREPLLDALRDFGSDYMTSEHHHPGYVLIPTEQFERIRSALLTMPVPGEPVGEAVLMLRKEGITAAHFDADKVPVGTKLYLHPSDAYARGAKDAGKMAVRYLEGLRDGFGQEATRKQAVLAKLLEMAQ